MLSVSSISPSNNATGVYRDANIVLTFSEEVHNSSLNGDNFKLYLSDWSGLIAIAIAKDPANHFKVILGPSFELAPNTQYAVWVRGDKNPADSTAQGVISEDGNVMNDHYISYFTTGDRTEQDINVDVQIGGYTPTVPGTPGMVTPDQERAILDANEVLDIIRTYPKDDATQVTDLSEIIYTFDQPIIVYGDATEQVEIEANGLRWNMSPNVPVVISSNVISNKLYVYTSGVLTQNTEYTIRLLRESVSGLPPKSEELVDDYVFSVLSTICPRYANPTVVRQRAGFLVDPTIPDSTIEKYILEASLWAEEVTGLSYVDCATGVYDPNIPTDFVRLVICKTILDIANGITAGTIRGIKEKQLADLRIVYNADGIDDSLDDIEDCIKKALLGLGFAASSQIGVKSIFGTMNFYPGHKRKIHQYNRSKFLNPSGSIYRKW